MKDESAVDADGIKALLDREGVSLFRFDPNGIIEMMAGRGLELLQLKPNELVGRSVFHLAHEDRANVEMLKRALNGERFVGNSFYASRIVEVQFSPALDTSGKVVGAWGVGIDVTERERVYREKDMLLEVSRVLDESLDYETALGKVANLALPVLADYCVIDLANEQGELQQISVAHVEMQLEDRLFELQRRHIEPGNLTSTLHRVLQNAKSELFTEIDEQMLSAYAQDESERELFLRLRPSSVMLVPLVARGRSFGVMSLNYSISKRKHTLDDVRLAESIAARAALAVDNARLYRNALESSTAKVR